MKTDRDYKRYYYNLKETIQELANLAGVKDLDRYYVPLCEYKRKRNSSDKLTNEIVMEQFALSLQNSGRGHKLIQFPADGKNPANDNERKVYEKFEELGLFNPDNYHPKPNDIYISCLADKLRTFYRYEIWSDKGGSVSAAERRTDASANSKDSLNGYVQGLFDAAAFLKEMHGQNEEDRKNGLKLICDAMRPNTGEWDESTMEDRPKRNKPNVLHELRKIDGLGPALSRDFLKECGCLWLAKPDVHLIAVLTEIGILDNLGDKNDYYSNTVHGANKFSKKMYEFAASVSEDIVDENVTPFKIDKMIWLASTGSFYLEEPPVTLNLREILIHRLKK